MDNNSELTNIFDNWRKKPRENLDFEMKTWLDLWQQSSRAKIAKELIALENHGWWYLIIGFDDKTKMPDEVSRPPNLDDYSVDKINAIIAKFAEPKFHVDSTIQKDSLGKEYPFIRVYWKTQVPVRSCSEDKDKNIIENRYYIRRPWPMSDMPKDGIEWDQLIKRCVLKQRREISETIASFMNQWFDLVAKDNTKTEDSDLCDYINTSLKKWNIENKNLEDNSITKNKHGYYYFSSKIIWKKKDWVQMKDLREKIRNFRKYTWWPIFLIIRKEPKFVSESLELSLLDQEFKSDHADFWRIWRSWINFSLRGYQVDCRDDYSPWEVFDFVIPVWRLGEYLLHTLDLGNFLYEDGFQILVETWWTWLKNRNLVALNWERFFFGKQTSSDDSYIFRITITDKEIQDFLPLVVQKILSGLYEKFDLFQPSYEFYEHEINKMRTWIR